MKKIDLYDAYTYDLQSLHTELRKRITLIEVQTKFTKGIEKVLGKKELAWMETSLYMDS